MLVLSKRVFTAFLVVVICLLTLLMEPGLSYASLVLEGQVVENGKKLAAGQTVKMTLRIYDLEFGGKLLFEEKQEVAAGLEKSLFTFEKGEVTVQKRTSGLQADSLWVEVETDGQVMTPRLSLAELDTTVDLSGGSLSLRGAGLRGVGNSTLIIGSEGITLDEVKAPFEMSGTIDCGGVIKATNDSDIGSGVRGDSTASSGSGIYGQATGSNGIGVNGYTSGTTGRAVNGYAANTSDDSNYGGHFTAYGVQGRGVYGRALATSGSNCGGEFLANGTSGIGVKGVADNSNSRNNYGGSFAANGSHGVGVRGSSLFGSNGIGAEGNGNMIGVYGKSYSVVNDSGKGVCGEANSDAAIINYGGHFTAKGVLGRGVYGFADNTSGTNYGGYFDARGASGRGVYAFTNGFNAHSVHAVATGTSGYAGYFSGDVKVEGNVNVIGTLSKSGGTFKIDHPLKPETRYLQHSFVESPDMMNIYNGNVLLDKIGEAVVEMPDYFEALNMDFRYQLTCIGGFAQIYIAQEIEGNSFKIAGGHEGLKVSWQVTGIRHDAWANANRIVVETDKSKAERGTYLNPEVFGK